MFSKSHKYKNNNLINFDTTTMALEMKSNQATDSTPRKAQYIDLIKHKLLTHIKKYGEDMLKLLMKTHVFTIKVNTTFENITLKPDKLESKQRQQI